MTKDKKTDKDNSSVIKALERRVKDLEDIIKNILANRGNEFEDKEKVSETKSDELKLKTKLEHKLDNIVIFNCKECDKNFNDKRYLKTHIEEFHKKIYKCKDCDEDFDSRWKLETHMQDHEAPKEFKCTQCDKEFYLKWRLNQHIVGHIEPVRKCCHYFNNHKVCPFESNGCKFRHEVSSVCCFGKSCTRHMCPFRHDVEVSQGTINKATVDNNIEVIQNDGINDQNDNDKSKALEEALERIETLEKTKLKSEEKLTLYSAAIRKLRKERIEK